MQTIIMTTRCPRCGSDGLVLMKRLDTGAVFAECGNCSSAFGSPDLTHEFPTADLYWERSVASMREARDAGWTSLAIQGALRESSEAPEPSVVAAWFVLDRIALERVPWWAAEWLELGYDGPNLRVLAGEDGDDICKIHDLLLAAIAEMKIALPSSAPEAAVNALDHVARQCRDGVITERETMELVIHIFAAADHQETLYDLPLGGLFGLEDEWDSGWGRRSRTLRKDVRRACAEQLARRHN